MNDNKPDPGADLRRIIARERDRPRLYAGPSIEAQRQKCYWVDRWMFVDAPAEKRGAS